MADADGLGACSCEHGAYSEDLRTRIVKAVQEGMSDSALLADLELASFLSHYGPEPLSEKLLECMLALPPSDRAELAEILGAKALEIGKRTRHR